MSVGIGIQAKLSKASLLLPTIHSNMCWFNWVHSLGDTLESAPDLQNVKTQMYYIIIYVYIIYLTIFI